MWQILLLSLVLFNANPTVADSIEIFDTDKERIVSTIDNSEAFQRMAGAMMESVTGSVADLSPPLEKSLIVKIPLHPEQSFKKQKLQIDSTIRELFVVMPKQNKRKPWLILHTKEDDTLLLEFTMDTAPLKELINKEWQVQSPSLQ